MNSHSPQEAICDDATARRETVEFVLRTHPPAMLEALADMSDETIAGIFKALSAWTGRRHSARAAS